jgi:hypothetical protein
MRAEFSNLLIDMVPGVPCVDGSVVCYLRAAVDYLILTSVALAILVTFGFLLAIPFNVVTARFARARFARARTRSRRRVLSGPTHTDGAWVRLVEDEHGRRVVEVLDGSGAWRPSTRSFAQFTIDVPLGVPRHG